MCVCTFARTHAQEKGEKIFSGMICVYSWSMTDGMSLPPSLPPCLLSVLSCYLLASLSSFLPPSVALFSSLKVETPGPERIEYKEKIVEVEVENNSMKQVQ